MSRYVGITGFVSREEVDFALSCLPEGLTLMCGVLVSAKTLRGIPNKWRRRYANPETMADIFSPDPRCLNLIHYSGDGDEGGVLNREKVRAYLRVAGEVMQAPTAPEKG